MELSTLRQRSVEALHRKAQRGELFLSVAVGYVRDGRDRIAMDPDRRVREAIALVFRKFAELGSIRQVHLCAQSVLDEGANQLREFRKPCKRIMSRNPPYAFMCSPYSSA